MRAATILVLILSCGLAVAGEAPAAPATPPAPAAEAVKPLDLAEAAAFFTQAEKITTSAQEFILQKKAMEKVKDRPAVLTFTVEEVRAVVFQKKNVFSVEGRNAAPEFTISAYVADEDKAFALNKGDNVTVRGTGNGIFFGKGKALVIVDATVVSVTPAAPPAPAPATP